MHCSWIIASRVHTIDELRPTVSTDKRFVRVRIDPFTPPQQDAYFNRPSSHAIGPRWQRTIGITAQTDGRTAQEIRERMDQLLRLPMTLWLIRKLCEVTPNGQPLPVFQTLSELALTVSRRLLQRALSNSATAVDEALKAQQVASPALDGAGKLRVLEHVLKLMAFQLMLEREYDGQIEGESRVEQFEERYKDRWFRELDIALEEKNLKPRKKLELEQYVQSAEYT